MAALGKIRSKGVTLVIIIALGLFAFIAEEAFRSCNGIKGEQSMQIGEVLGEKINVQEFQALIQEAEDFQKAQSGLQNLNEQQQTQIREQVWQQYVAQKIIENEAEKLGLTVTDDEVMDVLKAGTSNILQSSIPIPQFYNQQTGRFDYTIIQQFLGEYNKAKAANQLNENIESIHTMWLYCEKQLRNNLLQEKYMNLIKACMLSNTVEAKMAINDQTEEATIQLASLAYSSIKDADVKVTDEELKAKYEELKSLFRHPYETRNIKYVDFTITASDADRKALNDEMAGYQKTLAEAEDPATALTTMASQIPYLGVPTSSDIYPIDIKAKIDSAAVGTSEVFETKGDNTLNIVRLVSKETLPDSVEFRAISVANSTSADSVKKAIEGGADFAAVAKNYGQPGDKQWFTNEYERQISSVNQDMRKYIDAMLHGEVNAVQSLEISQAHIILQVTDRRAMNDKYVVAVVKKPIDYSKATRSAAYNKFSEYVAKNQTLDGLQKNAKAYGYTVQEQRGLATSAYAIGGVQGTGLKEPLKWVFKAKAGEVSPLYEANDHLLVVYLESVDEAGYLTLDNAEVKEFVKREVIKDKKAEQLLAKLKGVNSVAAAQQKGAKVETLEHVTFAQPVSIPSLQAFEPALSGAVARTAQGKFVSAPVKGNAGVYVFQVVKKQKTTATMDEASAMQACVQQNYQILASQGNAMNVPAFVYDMYLKANIVDNRYLFF